MNLQFKEVVDYWRIMAYYLANWQKGDLDESGMNMGMLEFFEVVRQ